MGENFQGENFNIYKYAKFGIQWDCAKSGFELKGQFNMGCQWITICPR